MTENEAIRLAMHIAEDLRRLDLPPVFLLMDTYDDVPVDDPERVACLEVHEVYSTSTEPLARITRRQDWEALLAAARVPTLGQPATCRFRDANQRYCVLDPVCGDRG